MSNSDEVSGEPFTTEEYAVLGSYFVRAVGVMAMLGHRNGAELDRYCERPGTEFGDLVLDVFVTANIGERGDEARGRVQDFIDLHRVDVLVAEAMV